jgi:hypothetical protein
MLTLGAGPLKAFVDPTGPAQLLYLTKILLENYKRYKQLKMMMDQAKRTDNYFKLIHHGLENVTGLMQSLPIKDHGILKDLKSFNRSLKTVTSIYGDIPKSPEQLLHKLHDQTVAESLQMVTAFKSYSNTQERNANSIKVQSQVASPKGAARATAVSNALILNSVNQLIRLQSQNLKMQSELLAMKNRHDKSTVSSYQRVDRGLGLAFKNFQREKGFIKF